MRKRRIDAEVINRMLDQYFKTAMRYARSPGNRVLQRQLKEDFADLVQLHLNGNADWLQTWGKFAELHRMSLAMRQGAGAAHIHELVNGPPVRFVRKPATSPKSYTGRVVRVGIASGCRSVG